MLDELQKSRQLVIFDNALVGLSGEEHMLALTSGSLVHDGSTHFKGMHAVGWEHGAALRTTTFINITMHIVSPILPPTHQLNMSPHSCAATQLHAF